MELDTIYMESMEENATEGFIAEHISELQSTLPDAKLIFGEINDDNSSFLQQEFFNETSLHSENTRLMQENSRLLKEFNQMREQVQLYRKEIRDIHEQYGIVIEGTLPPIQEKKSRAIKDLEKEMKAELLKRDQVIKAQACQIRQLRDQLAKRT